MVNIICVYLQHSEDPILARQDRYEASQVLWGQTCDIIDFVSREVVVLVLAVTVVVVDVTCTHKKISSWDMPGKKIHAVQYSEKSHSSARVSENDERKVLHGVNALSEVGFKGEELFALLGESSDLRTRTNKDLLLGSSRSSTEVHSGYFLSWKCFKHRLKQSHISCC